MAVLEERPLLRRFLFVEVALLVLAGLILLFAPEGMAFSAGLTVAYAMTLLVVGVVFMIVVGIMRLYGYRKRQRVRYDRWS